ncbi:smalltalk protein [Bacteroides cellulosilyticus]|nr:smalltalk protein [Bacteroides cellulosilyticus]
MAIKKSVWSMILKMAVAVITTIAGVLGVNAMTL